MGQQAHMRIDRRPVVNPGTEHRTICIQMSDRGCCQPGYYGEYEPGKVNLSPDEFYEAISSYNDKFLPCWTFFCCLWPCCRNERHAHKVTRTLNEKYKSRNIRFRLDSRAELVTNVVADLKGDPNVHGETKHFLIITQN